MTPLLLALLLLSAQTEPGAPAEPDAAAVYPGPTELGPLYTPPVVRPFEMPPGASYDSLPSGLAPSPAEAVQLEAYTRSYEGPKTVSEQVYERGVRGAFDSAQGRMGGLDGEWSVVGADGAPLLAIVLNDPGFGQIDGAWRDLRAGPGVSAVDLLQSVTREGAEVVVRFAPHGQSHAAELRLTPGPGGRLVGSLRTASGVQRVTATRS